MHDIHNRVSMSSFIDEDKVLVQIAHRFMLFNVKGHFLDDIECKDVLEER